MWTLLITVEDCKTGEVTEFAPSEHALPDAAILMMLDTRASFVVQGLEFWIQRPVIDVTRRTITLRGLS